MAVMQKTRLADANLNVLVRDLMSQYGFAVVDFKVMDSFPSLRQKDESLTTPTIVVTSGLLFGANKQLGSRQWPNLTFSLDIFAQSDGQRDDLAYYFWDSLNEKTFTNYDFNSGFPDLTTAISYSGLVQSGDFYIENVNSTPIRPPEVAKWEGDNHHQTVFGVIRLTGN